MPITITEFTDQHCAAVEAFNGRLRAGGMSSQFPTGPVPAWLPPAPGRSLFQRYYVALDENAVVRGAYILKHQEFQVGGQVVNIGDCQLPISEGPVDRTYVSLATRLLVDALGKSPLLYGLGMGSYQEPVARLFAAAGWRLFTVPFLFKIHHPFRLLRRMTYLRRSTPRRLVFDAAAWTGLGWLAVKTIHALRTKRAERNHSFAAERVDEFGPWADEVWESCRSEYGMIAVRSGEVLRILYPKEDPKFIRLRIREGERMLGWAVLLDSQFAQHKYFGSLRVGTFVDGLAACGDAAKVVAAATECLQKRGVDLIVTNQAHARWCEAFAASGFLRGPSNFIFAGSRQLAKLMETSAVKDDATFLNRGDGDGPIHL